MGHHRLVHLTQQRRAPAAFAAAALAVASTSFFGACGGGDSKKGDAAVCAVVLADPPSASEAVAIASDADNALLKSVAKKGGLMGPGISAADFASVKAICRGGG